MRATSAAQEAAASELSVPGVEEIRPGTWVVPLAMPDTSLAYMLCYVIKDDRGGVHVIDPGWASDDNWVTLSRAIEATGSGIADVKTISLTHLHRDHLGLANRLRAASGAAAGILDRERDGIIALESPGDAESTLAQLEAWGVPPARQGEILGVAFPSRVAESVEIDELLVDGQLLNIPGRTVRVLHTPGHTSGHVCFVDESSELLFTGDHVLPTVYPGLGLGGPSLTNPVDDYLSSLERLAPFDNYEVLPGHGYRFVDLADRRADLADHVQRRTDGVAAILSVSPDATVWQIAEQLEWTAGWHNLRGTMLRSALAQTTMHADRVRARTS